MTSGGRFDFDDGGTYCGGWEDGKAHGYGVCTGPKSQGEYAGAWHCGFEISGIYTWSSGNHYRGQWTQGKRHGVGVETKGRWIYQGEWTQGFKGRYGVRQSSTTGAKYEGTWTTGLQDGYGVETYADGGTYSGQWLRGIRHGYGVRQSVPYGQAAHGRTKPTTRESLTSLRSEAEDDHVVKDRDRKIDESRGGFVLTARGYTAAGRVGGAAMTAAERERDKKRGSSLDSKATRSSLRKTLVEGLKIRKQRSTGDIQDATSPPTARRHPGPGGSVRSTISYGSSVSRVSSNAYGSLHTDSDASFISQEDDDVIDINMIESYYGEWKNDKRSGFGVSERSDGLKYEGEWENNKKHGYGRTTFRDKTTEEGKYKANELVSSGVRSRLFILRASKLRDRVENAVLAAQRASQIAAQKSDIAMSRMASARTKAELAQQASSKALGDAEKARVKATEYAPEFSQPGADKKDGVTGGLTSKTAAVANHIGPTDPLLKAIENHIPPPGVPGPAAGGPQSTARNLLARVGIGGGDQAPVPSIGGALLSAGLAGIRPVSADDKRATSPSARAKPQGGASTSAHHSNPTPPSAQTPTYPVYEDYEVSDYVEVKTTAPTTAAPPSKNHPEKHGKGGKGGAGTDPSSSRFSALLTPAVIADHFDQYETASRTGSLASRRSAESGGTRRGRLPPSMQDPSGGSSRPDCRQGHNPTQYSTHVNGDGSSVYGEQEDDFRSKTRPLERRKTLPAGDPAALLLPHQMNQQQQQLVANHTSSRQQPTANHNPSYEMTSRISSHRNENGRPGGGSRGGGGGYASPMTTLKEEPSYPARAAPVWSGGRGGGGGGGYSSRPPVQARGDDGVVLRRSVGNKGSMPDVNEKVGLLGGSMPREEVHMLSLARREELRRQREEEERRRQQEIVVGFNDIKDWCQQRQLLVLVIAINISLATVFLHMLH